MRNEPMAINNLSSQQFYHGTKADLKPGDPIEPGYHSNYGQRKKATYIPARMLFNKFRYFRSI
jgi:hypothetical protein